MNSLLFSPVSSLILSDFNESSEPFSEFIDDSLIFFSFSINFSISNLISKESFIALILSLLNICAFIIEFILKEYILILMI